MVNTPPNVVDNKLGAKRFFKFCIPVLSGVFVIPIRISFADYLSETLDGIEKEIYWI